MGQVICFQEHTIPWDKGDQVPPGLSLVRFAWLAWLDHNHTISLAEAKFENILPVDSCT
jgi:hypothetical protein